MEQTELFTVAELATRWNVGVDFIYRRLEPSHPQHIPHVRLPNGHPRFDTRLLGGYLHLSQERSNVATVGSTARGGCYMPIRQRDIGSHLAKTAAGKGETATPEGGATNSALGLGSALN